MVWRSSLRIKLVLATVVVEVVMLSLLLANNLRLARQSLQAQTEQRIAELNVLFEAALAAPLVQRDYATLQEVLGQALDSGGVRYAVLQDRHGRILAEVGQRPQGSAHVSERFDRWDPSAEVAHIAVPIRLSGESFGRLDYSLSLRELREAQDRLLRQGLAIAGVAVALSILILASLGLWLTRHLRALTEAARQVGSGQFEVQVRLRTRDEVGVLAQSFNRMASAIAERVRALATTESELRHSLLELKHAQSEQERLARQASDEHARLLALLSAMNLGVLFIGSDGRVVYHNPALRRIWLIPEDAPLVGESLQTFLSRAAIRFENPKHFSQTLAHTLASHAPSESVELHLADGRVLTQLGYPVHDAYARYLGQLWIYEDVTHERQTAAQLAFLAEHDALTGLYNRHSFQEALERMLADCERNASTGAVLFFDLDEFKVINDNFGHRVGDSLLIRVASELKTMVRRHETLARLGGDEFAMVIPHASEQQAIALAERIVRTISGIPFRSEGSALRLTCSVGIALYPQHGADAETLIAHADAAMYQAKLTGKNTWRLYSPQQDALAGMVQILAWNERIDQALEQGLFRLHFQGVYRLDDGALAHLEALLRLQDAADPDNLILPGRFIPQAEKSKRILAIDRWVIREAIRILAEHPNMPPLAINLSGRSLDDAQLPHFLTETLRRHAVAPQRLMIELTETSAVSDIADAQRFIEHLHAIGCRICLDDFGSGFSSFAYLKHLPVDTVKIDGMFIRNLAAEHDDQIFVKAIADVARGMRRSIVAEFVENAETLALLKGFGVDLAQGYYLDRPRPDHPGLIDAGIRCSACQTGVRG